MRKKRGIFIYPQTKESLKKENNNYVSQLIKHFGQEFKIVNGISEIGLVDALLKLKKTDVYYFNWIENLPTKRFGFFQLILLIFILILCKILNKKIIWFVHNNISHDKKYYQVKKFIVRIMSEFADLILAHSNEIKLKLPKDKLQVFHHPIENYQPLNTNEPFSYDMLIWGAVMPYKGIAEFVEYASKNLDIKHYKILIAGKFDSEDYHNRVLQAKSDNITVINRFITDEELINLFSQSRYILFTYVSSSVLSSAALCKSLSFGKEIIAPNVGSFKELGEQDLIYTFSTFAELETLLLELKENRKKRIKTTSLHKYIQDTSWDSFSQFTVRHINFLFSSLSKYRKSSNTLSLLK